MQRFPPQGSMCSHVREHCILLRWSRCWRTWRTEEADIWTLARALQLLDSKDQSVSDVAMAQLEETIKLGYGRNEVPFPLPINEYLAGSMEMGLSAIWHGGASMNLWTRARKASICLKRIRVDVSGEEYSNVIADDISSVSIKTVRGLRTAVRQRWTNRLLFAAQGRVATGLALDLVKENAALLSCRTPLTFQEWHFLHKARLGILPVRGGPGSMSTVKTCRLGCSRTETTDHVVNGCQVNSALSIKRHNAILTFIADETEKHIHVIYCLVLGRMFLHNLIHIFFLIQKLPVFLCRFPPPLYIPVLFF